MVQSRVRIRARPARLGAWQNNAPGKTKPAARRGGRTAPGGRSRAREDAAAARRPAASAELIGHRSDGCSGVAPADDDGWRVSVDVVEVPRIPDTTSLLATYEVDLASDGDAPRLPQGPPLPPRRAADM